MNCELNDKLQEEKNAHYLHWYQQEQIDLEVLKLFRMSLQDPPKNKDHKSRKCCQMQLC